MEGFAQEKNAKSNKDISITEDVSLKTKIFTFYFYVLRKRDINLFISSFLLLLETLQLISYAFTTPHTTIWRINLTTMDYVQLVIGAARITPLMKYLQYNYYIIIYIICLGYIFIHCLLVTMIIKFNKTQSKFYQLGVAFTRYFTSTLTIFLMIPIAELILLPLKCENGRIAIIKDGIECWNGLHYLYVVLSCIFVIMFFIFIFFSIMFYFDAFNNKKTTTKLDTSAELFFALCKMISVIRFIIITDEYISIIIMVLISIFNLKKGYENPTYNNYFLECFLSIRNTSFCWSFIILLIAKISEGSKINGLLYLIIFGYPLIVTVSIIYYRKKSQNFMLTSSNFNDVNEYITRMKYMIKLIESYFNKNKSGKANKNNTCKKDEILLKGIIAIHEESCVTEECPLKKFEENMNNFSIQKTCLLHYMNNLFTEGIKKFPNSRLLLMIFVQFNYEKKYNLNAAKTYLTKLEKQKNTLTEDYIIFSIKQNISNMNNKMNIGLSDNEEMLKIEDTIEQKYKRLKFLVETTTKLYGEFWGILATNLTNNLNLNKLFMVGNKLNKFLNEINTLWETDLKNKKIDLENQSTAQLYAYFLREILKNKKRSEEITKKLNEEQHYEARKTDSDKFDLDNLEIILESQDYVIYSRTNEKGECDIIQCSNSIVYLLGHIKQELIGKNIETIMPSVFANEHNKMLAQRIKVIRTKLGSHKDNFRASDKKQIFILPKTKVGYLLPINARFTVYNDNDFSNTYIVKSKFENKDTKSIYAFYVLTKDDFTVDSISSSAINLGLSMDLLKKYVINMNVLLRSENENESIVLEERYVEYEEEPKKVTWIFPDLIYPKNDSQRKKEENLNELIKQSEKKELLLLITKIKYNEEEALGYCFKFTEVETKKGALDPYDFNTTKTKHILFDMLRLNYVRTVLVTEKSKGYQDNRPVIVDTSSKNSISKQPTVKASKKAKRKGGGKNNEESELSDDEQPKVENLITKEKLIELQARNSDDVKAFIVSLQFYGADVSLEKHRPNKERYPVGKAQEPEIKISISGFIKRIEEKLRAHPERKHEVKNASSVDAELTSSLTTGYSSDSTSDSALGSEFTTDVSASLGNIFNEKSITYIQFSCFSFFLIICAIISVEFGISLSSIEDSSQRMGYMDKGYIMLNSLMYTKFFLTEAIVAQQKDDRDGEPLHEEYIKQMMEEMSACRQDFANTYSHFSNATVTFSDEYKEYTDNTQVYIKTLSNGNPTIEHQPFSTAMSRIPTSIFYVSTVTDNFSSINMTDRNSYELMNNLLNDYFLIWRTVTFLLVDDVLANAKSKQILIFIFGFSFLISVIFLFILWKLITRFIEDREKPVDLFLTIKKKKFEELKNASDSFTNKLLNKFFGNEDAEEESVIDYSINMKEDDINIVKFKTKNEYKQSLRTSSEYLLNYIKIVIFFIVLQCYLIFKYCFGNVTMKNINQFADVFNMTHYSQSDIILSLDVTKSFFFDKAISIFNENDTENIFRNTFQQLSDSFEKLLVTSYNTTCFLQGSYIKSFYNWLNKDISQYIQLQITEDTFLGTYKYGFKSVIARYFELIKYICLTYMTKKEEGYELDGAIQPNDTEDNSLVIYPLEMEEFNEINDIAVFVIRPWYNNLISEMNKNFSDYVKDSKLVNISTFIVVLCCIVLLYCLVWKSYEENLKTLLKTSVDLINLIPEEIKYQIVQKLNEEENKNE